MDMILLAIVIGAAFGFTLDRIGATNPSLIIGMLRLGRMHLMKTILLAIGVAAILLFGGLLLGLVDPGNMSVKAAQLAVPLGGALLGAGFAVAGYCPGTGIAAAAAGRRDALFFIAGGLLGAAAYMLVYPAVKAAGLTDPILGGKTTLGGIEGAAATPLLDVSGEVVGLVMGVAFVLIAALLPARIRGDAATVSARSARMTG